MARDTIFIVGTERSGTTVLRKHFAAYGALDADEIFHGTLNHPYRFYGWLAARVREDEGLIFPVHHQRLFRDYLDWLRAEAAGAPVVLDVKYAAFNLIAWTYGVEPATPFFAEFVRADGVPVVHLVRRNKLRVIASNEVATRTDVWGLDPGFAIPTEKRRIELPIGNLVARIDGMISADRRAGALLDTNRDYVRLVYEDLFRPDGTFDDPVVATVARLTGRPDVDPVPRESRMNPEPLSALVTNLDAVRAALEGSAHGWMADG